MLCSAGPDLFAFFFVGQATGPQLLGSILKANGYGPTFITRRRGTVHSVALISRQRFAGGGRYVRMERGASERPVDARPERA